MPLPIHLLPTAVVGGYPQPDWLVDRAVLSKSVPRARMHEMWRLPAEHLERAQDDATIVPIRDTGRAGIDTDTPDHNLANANQDAGTAGGWKDPSQPSGRAARHGILRRRAISRSES